MKKDHYKTKAQLIDELGQARLKISELENNRDAERLSGKTPAEAESIPTLIFNNNIMGIALVRNRIFETVNPRICELLRMPRHRVAGSSTRIIYASDQDYAEKGREMYSALCAGEWSEMELAVWRADETSFISRIVGKALDPSRPEEGAIWLFEDITDRKRMEENLRESEENYRTVVANADEGIIIAQDECFAYVNPKMADDILGVPAEQLVNRPFIDYIYPEDREMVVNKYRQRLAGKILRDSYEFRVISRKKKNKWVSVSANRINWNGRPATLNMYTDVTERRKTETALRESEAKYRLLVDNSYDLIWTVDADSVITYASPSWKKNLGYEPSFAAGKPFRYFIHPDDIDFCVRAHREAVRLRKEMQGVAYRVKHDAGDWRWYEASGTPVFDPDGALLSFVGICRDINDRKQAEEELKKSQSTLFSIIEFLPDAAIVIDLQGKVIAWNLAMEVMTGISKQEAFSRADHSFTSPFYGERRKYLLDLIDASDQELESRYRYVTRKGNALYAESFAPSLYGGKGAHIFAAAAPLFDNRGNRFGYIELVRDVTDCRRAEEGCREAHKRMDQIIEYLPDATFVIDAGGKVIAWNKAIEQMTGMRAADMLGKGNYEHALPFYGERRPMLIDLVLKPQKIFEAAYANMERKGLVLDGEAYMPALRGGEVYLMGRASVLHDSKGNIAGAMESVRDITERTKAEEKYRRIFNNAVMGIFHTTPGGRMIDANPALARILGYDSPEEVVATVTDVARQMYYYPGHRAEFEQLMNTQGNIREHEIQLVRKDGDTVLVAVSGRPVKDGAGKLLYYEGTIQDITERKRLEVQLRQAQKMEAIGTLTGGIAHDFNNILGGILGYTELAMSRHIPSQHPAYRYLEGSLRSINRAKDLVAQMMVFSRRQEQKRMPVNIRPIVKEALKLLRASLPATIRIDLYIDPSDSLVLADPTQIHQILMNLVTNSAYAINGRTGSIEITLKTSAFMAEDALPCPELKPGILYQVLTVRDTGRGIDSKHVPRIFDPFFTTKKTGEGTGLGLSVVYGIVKSYDGVIAVESEPDKGTTFQIFIQAVTGRNALNKREEIHIQRGSESIMFVDDEHALTEIFSIELSDLGYRVTTYNDPLTALDDFRRRPADFDLVITDMTMQDMTGEELACELIRIRSDIRVLLCTGHIEEIDHNRFRCPDIRKVIKKPLAIHDLASSIRQTLDGD